MMRAFVIAALVVLSGAAQAQDLLRPGDTISGKLRLVQTRHPNGTRLTAYQVVVDNPRPLAEKDEFCGDTPPRTFHLVVMDDKAKATQLKRLLGKKLNVVLDSFFCSETAWHVGDAVVFQWHVVPE
jgi:hypothetical protein